MLLNRRKFCNCRPPADDAGCTGYQNCSLCGFPLIYTLT